jgi:hypothetical protein
LIFAFTAPAAIAWAEDGVDQAEDGKENPWGAAAIDHKLNAGWEYPSDYVKRPLVYNRRVVEFGANFQYRYVHHYWDDEGKLIAGSFKTKRETVNLFLGGGFSDNWSVSINWPFTYKKTVVYPGNQNYRAGRVNTYGALAEEAAVNFLDHSDPWKLWEAQLPQLGDVNVWSAYQFFRRLDPTTSIAVETNIKWATGNDNPRRGSVVRNYLTSGQSDWYGGLGLKQSAWKFGFELHGGYNWRMPADTKYTPGKLDIADQALANGEISFQVPKAYFIDTFAIACAGHYMYRVMESTVEDKLGNKIKLGDYPGYEARVEPKIIYQWDPDFDIYFTMDIPLAGQNSFLVYSHSYYLPPYEIEGNDGVGITYTLGLKKRWN